MRLLVTGSRDWTGRSAEYRVWETLDTLQALCLLLNSPLHVTHGGARGLDTVVDGWCLRRDGEGVTVAVYPADWKRFKNAAGPIRNQVMVDLGHDLCIGFVKDNSPGTLHCLALARNAGVPTYVVPWDNWTTEHPAVRRKVGVGLVTDDGVTTTN